MSNVIVCDHPLVQHKISLLRDKNTGAKEFRELVQEIAMFMCYEATRDLPLKQVQIETPLGLADSNIISGRKVAFVPIMRAGLGMMEGALALVPAAKVGHIGLYRDEETLEPHEYYCKLPKDTLDGQVIVVDPALATGGSASAAIRFIKERGFKRIKLLSLIGAPQGVKRVTEDHPDVKVYVAHYADAPLNEHGYIVTAFGDAGDRIFGTK